MLVIGVTGGSGAGKSSLLRLWEDQGAFVIDADHIYHELLNCSEPMRDALAARFPTVVKNGGVSRRALSEIVFSDPEALEDLGRITHGFVVDEIVRQLEAARTADVAVAVIEAIYLLERLAGVTVTKSFACAKDTMPDPEGSSGTLVVDCTVGVVAKKRLREMRIYSRDKLTLKAARARIAAQRPDSYYREHCDYILENNGETLREDGLRLWQELTATGEPPEERLMPRQEPTN